MKRSLRGKFREIEVKRWVRKDENGGLPGGCGMKRRRGWRRVWKTTEKGGSLLRLPHYLKKRSLEIAAAMFVCFVVPQPRLREHPKKSSHWMRKCGGEANSAIGRVDARQLTRFDETGEDLDSERTQFNEGGFR